MRIRIERTEATEAVSGYALADAVYQVELVDSTTGQPVDSGDTISQIFLILEFDPTKWVPYQDPILYRETGGEWTVFPNDHILSIDYSNNTITIESDHLSEWSLMSLAARGSSTGGTCFITTASLDSYTEPHVLVLRGIRDRSLLVGRTFVKWYYSLTGN